MSADALNAAGPPRLGDMSPKPSLVSPSAGDFPDVVEVVVEIPRGSRNKYEWDEKAGVFRLDRVLASAVHYNFDYGFIEGRAPATATTPTPCS